MAKLLFYTVYIIPFSLPKIKSQNFLYFFLTIVFGIQYNVIDIIMKGGKTVGNEEILSGLILELRRGSLVMLVLSQLKKPMYGYNLVQNLCEHNMPIEANTLYPLMRRLESQGLLSSEWETSGAKPRKYYSITESGRTVLAKIEHHWHTSVKNINLILEENENEK